MRAAIARLSYANVVSTLALCVALSGGVAFASGAFKGGPEPLLRTRAVHQGTPATSTANKEVTAKCPGTRLPIGGGAAIFFGALGFVALERSRPLYVGDGGGVNGWAATANEVNGGSTQNWSLEVWAICAKGVTPPG